MEFLVKLLNVPRLATALREILLFINSWLILPSFSGFF